MLCPVCQSEVETAGLLSHLRRFHRIAKNLSIQCGVGSHVSCSTVFHTISAFQSHWYAHHHTRAPPATVPLVPSKSTPAAEASTSSTYTANVLGSSTHNFPPVVSSGVLACNTKTATPVEGSVPDASSASDGNHSGDVHLTREESAVPQVQPASATATEHHSSDVSEASKKRGVDEVDSCDSSDEELVDSVVVEDDGDWSDSGSIYEESNDNEKNIVFHENIRKKRGGFGVASNVNPAAGLYVLSLREKYNVSESKTFEILKDTQSLIESCVKKFVEEVKNLSEEVALSLGRAVNVPQLIKECSAVFEGLETKSKQDNYFREKFNNFEIKKKVLGRKLKRKFVGRSKERRTVLLSEKVIYVPIIQSLEKLLSHPEFDEILQKSKEAYDTDENVLDSYMKGTAREKNRVIQCHPDAFRIILYYDEMDPCDALGSKAGKHKTGCFYFVLENIHPKFRSNLDFIILAGLVNYNVAKDNGMDLVMSPLIEDLQKLENGVVLGSGQIIHGTVIAFIGDNLGCHTVAGFKEGFTAHCSCRHCLIDRENLQTSVREDLSLLRNPENHEDHISRLYTKRGKVDKKTSTKYGINRNSKLNSLGTFHVTTSMPPDIMHDLLEGICKEQIQKLLNHLLYELNPAVATLEWLNGSIQDFDYGYSEVKDKPSEIKADHIKTDPATGNSKGNLHQSAAQTWILMAILPLILGPHVDHDDAHWLNFLDLLEIVRIVFAPKIHKHSLAYLADLIETYLTDYQLIYRCLTPKQHYLLHYPRLIALFGSLYLYWCMRMEANHKRLKQKARSSFNFSDIQQTMANQYQLHQTYAWSKSLLKTQRNGKLFVLNVTSDLPFSSLLQSYGKLVCTEWLEVEGQTFKPDQCCISVACNDFVPTFSSVKFIVVWPKVMFVCKSLQTVEHNPLMAAFKVEETEAWAIHERKDMLSHSIYHLHNVLGDSYIFLKFCVQDSF